MILTSHWDNLENMIIDQNEALFLTLKKMHLFCFFCHNETWCNQSCLKIPKILSTVKACLAKDFSSWEETGLGQ